MDFGRVGGMTGPSTVDEYIDAAPEAARSELRELRSVVRDADPAASEQIKYGMPTYEHDRHSLLNFAATKRHVAVYGLVHVDRTVPVELAPYLHERSTLRFELGEALPSGALAAAISDKVKTLASKSDR
jgi:uncharacterized protein YdhG (YjbR/CyaY superfamily)